MHVFEGLSVGAAIIVPIALIYLFTRDEKSNPLVVNNPSGNLFDSPFVSALAAMPVQEPEVTGPVTGIQYEDPNLKLWFIVWIPGRVTADEIGAVPDFDRWIEAAKPVSTSSVALAAAGIEAAIRLLLGDKVEITVA